MHLAITLVVLLGGVVCGCSGGDGDDAAATLAEEPQSGGATFLLASFTTLAELRPDGSRAVLATAGAGAFIRYPAISPDGKMLAYSRQGAATVGPNGVLDFGADIYLLPRAGGEPREVVHHAKPGQFLGAPIFVDGNSRLLYSSRGLDDTGQPELHIASVDLKSGASKIIIELASEPSISTDGRELVFVSYAGDYSGAILATTNLDGSNRRTVIPASANLEGIISPVFSPDGKRIAFAAMQKYTIVHSEGMGSTRAHPSTHDIWVVNRDGSQLRTFADLAEINPSLTWSGDGRWLYVLGQSGIWQIEAAGKDVTRVGQGYSNAQFVWLTP